MLAETATLTRPLGAAGLIGNQVRPPIAVDPTRCQECGECVRECVRHQTIPSGTHVDHSSPLCSRCLHCYAVCPAGAIVLSEAYVPLDDDRREHEVTPERLQYLMAYRRSTRRFQEKPLPRDLIERVVQAGRYIPSGGNRHAYAFTVITDPGVKDRLLVEFARFYDRIRRLMGNRVIKGLASLFLGPYEQAFLRDPDYSARIKDLLDRFHAGDDPVFYRAPAAIVIHSRALIPTPKEDSILAGYNMVLMAQTLGLGTCFVTLAQKALNANPRCKAILGLDPGEQVHAVVLLGYPAVRYRRAAPKPLRPIHWV
jgi:nitroreductase/NAD-dependent dihydropyrimidine dehydrogenase PreA subunit